MKNISLFGTTSHVDYYKYVNNVFLIGQTGVTGMLLHVYEHRINRCDWNVATCIGIDNSNIYVSVQINEKLLCWIALFLTHSMSV